MRAGHSYKVVGVQTLISEEPLDDRSTFTFSMRIPIVKSFLAPYTSKSLVPVTAVLEMGSFSSTSLLRNHCQVRPGNNLFVWVYPKTRPWVFDLFFKIELYSHNL